MKALKQIRVNGKLKYGKVYLAKLLFESEEEEGIEKEILYLGYSDNDEYDLNYRLLTIERDEVRNSLFRLYKFEDYRVVNGELLIKNPYFEFIGKLESNYLNQLAMRYGLK